MIPLLPLVVGGAALGLAVAKRRSPRSPSSRLHALVPRGAPSSLVPPKDPRAPAYASAHAHAPRVRPPATRNRYVVAIAVSFPASLVATTDKVAEQAHKMGISDASASRKAPRDLPMARADFYVTGTFAGDASSIPRSFADGKVRIVDVARVS